MDQNSGPQRGGAGKRLLAANYVLELVPDARSAERRRRRSYHHSESLFHLPSRGEDHRVHRQGRNKKFCILLNIRLRQMSTRC
ncbi:hypothetical protein GBAR_LOCUS13236, partial [Geodia barretti]